MDQKKPSDALTKPSHRNRLIAIGAAGILAVSGIGVGGYALTQNLNQPTVEETVVAADEVEPTPEPTPNAAPTAIIATSISDLTVAVDGSGSTDAEGSVATYEWDFGDGGGGSLPSGAHVYAAGGTYTITLTVTDAEGSSGSTSTTVTVTAPAAPPPSSGGYSYGNYPPGYPVPNTPGTDSADASACASKTALETPSGPVCA